MIFNVNLYVLTVRNILFFFFLINIFIYLFLLCWVFVSVRGLSLVAASGGHSSSRCMGLSLSRPLLLQSTGSRRAGSVVVAHGPSCSAACGILPDQGSNPCPLHWQADSQPLCHQGSPKKHIILNTWIQLKNCHKVDMTKSRDDSLQTFYHSRHQVFSNIILVCRESTILYHVFSYLYSETSLQVIRILLVEISTPNCD